MTRTTWAEAKEPTFPRPNFLGWCRVIVRGLPIALLVFGGCLILLMVRLIERPLCGTHRPITPHITVFACRNALRLMGLGYRIDGFPMRGIGIMVANHTSWLDIFSLNAAAPLYFVSKSDVAGWPGIGWLARATGTVFIERDRSKAKEQTDLFERRLRDKHRLLFFPEGTSTDGLQVIAFKSTLFAAVQTAAMQPLALVQPVSVVYHAPEGSEDRFYGWWGDMDFGTHLLRTLAAPRQGRVEIRYHEPLKVADFPNRKALAKTAETCVREGHAALRASAR